MGKFIGVKVKMSQKGDVAFSDLKKQYKDLAQKHVTIGILEPGRAYPDDHGVTVGEVALWQEFGTKPKNRPPVPARSFLRTPFDTGLPKILALKDKLLGQIVAGKVSVVQALAVLGADSVRRMQAAIKKRIGPPLRPYTLKMRREQGITGTIPLYATHLLFNSIHFVVRSKKEEP